MSEFLAEFLLIFLAALPGRTTFVMIVLAATERARDIIVGAALAFAVQCVISVGIGYLLHSVPIWITQLAAGVLFLFFAWRMWKESLGAVHSLGNSEAQSIASVFTLVFTAEFGDVSQLAIATAAMRASSHLTVLLAALAALWLITLGAVAFGRMLGHLLKPALIQKIASVAFALIGVYLIGSAILALR